MGIARNRRKRIIRGNRGLSIYILCIVALFAYLIFRIAPEKKTLLTREVLRITSPGVAYAFKAEDHVVIYSESPISFIPQEGDKIAASTLLSDDFRINEDDYINQRISAISLYQNEAAMSEAGLNGIISSLIDQSASLQTKLVAEPGNAEYKNELASVKRRLSTAYLALNYIRFSSYELNIQSENLQSLLGSEQPLTPENLNFSIYGTVTYELDGYEGVMGFDDLYAVNGEYLDKLSAMAPVNLDIQGRYVLKSEAQDKLVVVIRCPADARFSKEESVLEKYSQYNTIVNTDDQGGYFNYLYKRVDLLSSFPTVKFFLEQGEEYSGKLVKIEDLGSEKLYYIAVRSLIADYRDLRIFTCDLNTSNYDCFSAEASCVYSQGDKYYVDISTGSSLRKVIEVFPTRITEDRVYFKVSENPSLNDVDELFLKGGK